MSVREFLKSHLTDGGLWPHEADVVIGLLVDEEGDSMAKRWHTDVDSYPRVMKAIWISAANRVAVKYIDANCPKHFARMMFTGEVPA